jgi:hypothetical protein
MAQSQLEQFRQRIALLRSMARERAVETTDLNPQPSSLETLLNDWAHKLKIDQADGALTRAVVAPS